MMWPLRVLFARLPMVPVRPFACSLIAAHLACGVCVADRPFFRAPRRRAAMATTPAYVSRPVNAQPTPAMVPRTTVSGPHLPPPSLVAPVPMRLPSATEQIVQRPTGTANVLIRIRQDFANRFVQRTNHNVGPVSECIRGAKVSGSQNTDSSVRLDFMPDETAAKFDFVLVGQSLSQTTNTTDRGGVNSTSDLRFDVRKSIEFNGQQFLTHSPGVFVDSRLEFKNAFTPVSQVPVIGSIASTIALNTANQQQPEARIEAAQRITNRLSPEFNNSIDARLATANETLAKVRSEDSPWAGLLNGTYYFRTTETKITAEEQIGDSSPLGTPAISEQAGAALRLHETAINSWLNSGVASNREFDAATIDMWISRFRDRFGESEPQGSSVLPRLEATAGTKIVFAGDSPVTVQFDRQQVSVVLRVTLKPMGMADLPRQRIALNYELQQTPAEIVLSPLPCVVEADDPSDAPTTMQSTLETVLQGQIQARLRPVRIARSIQINPERPAARLTVQNVAMSDGWLAVDWE
jgi:hypothetical protein